MSLSDTKARNAKGREKQYKLMDDLGLYLLVKPNGSRLWRFDYQLNGKRKTLAFGKYPAISLVEARSKRDDARNQLANGTDPSFQKKLDKITEQVNAANTFEVVAKEVIANAKKMGRARETLRIKQHCLTLSSDIAQRPVSEIKPAEILAIMSKLEARGLHETVDRVLSLMGEVFKRAIRTGRAEYDPSQPLKGIVTKPPVVSHPAIINEKEFGELMRALTAYSGWTVTSSCLTMIALTVARPTEVRLMRWSEVDFEKKQWTIPAARTKMRRDHVVPLSTQALEILTEMRRFHNRNHPFVFLSLRFDNQPLGGGTLNAALKRAGCSTDRHVPHGFRSSFSTIMNERGFDPEVIEHCLAHVNGGVRGIYNRAKYLNPRRELLQTWADLVDEFKAQSKGFAEAAE